MDGFKRKINYSIQFKLSLWISAIIILMAIFSVIISYFSALNEAGEIQDENLKQVARLVQKNQINPLVNDEVVEDFKILTHPLNSTLNRLTDGLHTLHIGQFNYRVLKLRLSNQQPIVIAQKTILRDEAALSGAVATALPMLLLLPILIIAAYLLIRHSFEPITSLSEDILKRNGQDLTPLLQTNVPKEILPFINSINELFDKVNHSIESQRRFIADAAHELRSPLTALTLQSERLANAEMSEIAAERLNKLRQGIARASSLLQQLLSLAKAQRLTKVECAELSVNPIVLHVLEDLIPIAETKNLNIVVQSEQDLRVNMNEADLICVIKNLLDNAVNYTPNGGKINLNTFKSSSYLVIEVEDNGRGIPDNEKEKVFDAFYRILGNNFQGSGLGLSIVKAIINRVDGYITLLDSQSFTSGLKVSVYLPLKSSSS